MAQEGVTNTGDIVGKVDQHVGEHESNSGYKYQYVDPTKNKKLGIITSDNVNHILYNLLWDIVSHQVDNTTAKGEMSEVNWLLRRFPKDSDRSDDTGVSNNTINKYIKKAKDIIRGMKEPVEEEAVYVDKGKITKKSSDSAKKLDEDISDGQTSLIDTKISVSIKESMDTDGKSLDYKVEEEADEIPDIDVKYPNGQKVRSEIDLISALMFNFGIDGKTARENLKENKYSKDQIQRSIDYWVEKTDGNPHWDEEKSNEEQDKAVIEAPVEEDSQVGKYSIRKVKENNVDKWAVYDEAGNLRATYPDEQTARNAAQGKRVLEEKVNEEYNPFKEMIKSDSPEWHRGLYTDGEGSFYEAPKSGTTKWQKRKNYKFRYDFGKNQIQIADNSGDIIYDSYLSIGSWLDNPDYWFERAMKEMDDEVEAYVREETEKVSEESGQKFSSIDELKNYLKDKKSVIILYQGNEFSILDEDVDEDEYVKISEESDGN